MDPRRLELLLELSRLGSMREVAESMGVTTSTVSQQLAVLAREARTQLVEPDGRRVRLTPAGQRLAGHAVTVLAALDAARADLDPDADPAGSLRVASYATGVRDLLLPVARTMAETHPLVRLEILEHEPDEAFGMLAADDVDLALTYDYGLVPLSLPQTMTSRPMNTHEWGLGVPVDERPEPARAADVFAAVRDRDWIVNSRNTADEEVVRIIAAMADFAPRITHRADSLDLVQRMIVAGLGVGLLPADQPTIPGVAVVGLSEPDVTLRGHAVIRQGRAAWPPLALLLRLLDEERDRVGSGGGVHELETGPGASLVDLELGRDPGT